MQLSCQPQKDGSPGALMCQFDRPYRTGCREPFSTQHARHVDGECETPPTNSPTPSRLPPPSVPVAASPDLLVHTMKQACPPCCALARASSW